MLLLAGDFRQTLPVIPRSTPADEIDACPKSSYLRRSVNQDTWTDISDTRVRLRNDQAADVFSNQLLSIENGKIAIGDLLVDSHRVARTFLRFGQFERRTCFRNTAQNRNIHLRPSERAMRISRDKDVDDLDEAVRNAIPGQLLIPYKNPSTQ